MWVLINHFRDEEEDWKKQELLCRFLNPSAASELFDKKDIEKTESTEDYMLEQVSKDLKGKFTPQELAEIFKDPKHFSELDRIEKVN
jgi:hypothetical protein